MLGPFGRTSGLIGLAQCSDMFAGLRSQLGFLRLGFLTQPINLGVSPVLDLAQVRLQGLAFARRPPALSSGRV
ncbi:hypothetical protein [Xanthomonas arboricola]|uniref:hypothetical protein n=3 Tax=Xanthomonas arboricola TaxID=56448 RepID=UPI00201A0096|nr:hypothetical protein [Xanthomonas arboricola]MDN0209843.1 hypothetical protein [Xanthomonas arboricola pv. corylina]UQQ12728.1 hypothetical protein KP021_11425 [Xanthomonas arboricola pv. corylina]